MIDQFEHSVSLSPVEISGSDYPRGRRSTRIVVIARWWLKVHGCVSGDRTRADQLILATDKWLNYEYGFSTCATRFSMRDLVTRFNGGGCRPRHETAC